MRVIFMGSPSFALPSLQALLVHHRVVGVVTQPDRPSGRGQQPTAPAVKDLAIAHELPYDQPASLRSDAVLHRLQAWSPELIVVAAFGQILPPAVLDLPPHGCLNVHASLLPRWRGAAPVQAAIAHGDQETGVTIMKMDPGLDTGPILSQQSTPIGPDETGGELADRLAEIGAGLLIKTIPAYTAGDLLPEPQPDEDATYTTMLKKSDGALQFDQSAEALARLVRAYRPWPGTHFRWHGIRLAVLSAHAESFGATPSEPGTGTVIGGMPAVAAADGYLVLDIVQPAAKRPMDGQAFLHGAPAFSGSRIEASSR